MNKSAYNNPNYPHLPPQMSAVGYAGTTAAGSNVDAHDEHLEVAAPPSYEQATTTVAADGSADTQTYPPVQVLPTPPRRTTEALNRQQQQQLAPAGQPYYGGDAYQGHPATHTNTYVTLQRPGVVGVTPMVHQQQPQPQSVVIIQQQAVMPLGPEPAYVFCPNCHIQKLTRIEYEPSTRTHLMAALLCVLGLWCCVCLPYCAGSCMNTNHYCGNCNKFLGSYGNAL